VQSHSRPTAARSGGFWGAVLTRPVFPVARPLGNWGVFWRLAAGRRDAPLAIDGEAIHPALPVGIPGDSPSASGASPFHWITAGPPGARRQQRATTPSG
jgi:hypothetical protein